MHEYAIYKPGELHLRTTVTDGICHFTDGMTAEEYLKTLPDGYMCLPFNTALRMIQRAEDKKYIGPLEEITAEQWFEALECLPPEKWERLKGDGEIFRMCEYMTGSITAHYVRYKNRYFMAYRRATDGTAYGRLVFDAALIVDGGN